MPDDKHPDRKGQEHRHDNGSAYSRTSDFLPGRDLADASPKHRRRPAASVPPLLGRVRMSSDGGASFPRSFLTDFQDGEGLWGTSTLPTDFMRFFPSFCFSRSLRFRVISPP